MKKKLLTLVGIGSMKVSEVNNLVRGDVLLVYLSRTDNDPPAFELQVVDRKGNQIFLKVLIDNIKSTVSSSNIVESYLVINLPTKYLRNDIFEKSNNSFRYKGAYSY